MTTLIVPTDFSDAARNATLYAIAFARQTGASRIVLYHSFNYYNVPDPMMGFETVELSDENESTHKLRHLKDEMQELATDLQIEGFHSGETIENGLDQICEMMDASMIIIGMKGGSKLKEVLIGSNAIKIARHAKLPVIIVPATVHFTRIDEVVLAIDFAQTDSSYSFQPVKDLLNTTGAKLFVLNVMQTNRSADEHQPDTHYVDASLKAYTPQYSFIQNDDYVQAINNFADTNNVDLVITFPKRHGWFEELFNPSHTRQLAFHSHVPLMAVH
jgi:nucleotide-binding universal stress UspA family protein